jgi:hypothetical protein
MLALKGGGRKKKEESGRHACPLLIRISIFSQDFSVGFFSCFMG